MSAPASARPVPSRAGTRRASLCSSRQTASRSTGRGRPWPTGTAGGPPGDRWSSTFLLLALQRPGLGGNATGTEAERSGLVEHHQVPAFVLQANGVHSRPYRFLQHTDEFLKCPVRVLGVIWHDPSSS